MSLPALAAPPAATYRAPALMRDGTSVLVRAIRPGDKPALLLVSRGGQNVFVTMTRRAN